MTTLVWNVRRRWRVIAASSLGAATLFGVGWFLMENPYNQTFGTTITSVPLKEKVIALTFDDGPNPPYTNQIVEYLHQEQVPATFFVVGRAVERYPDIVRREVDYGDAVGNHSWDHAHLILEPKWHIRAELAQTDAAIYKATGQHTKLFRPPFGARDYAVVSVAHDMGYEVIMWSVPLARDWMRPTPDVIADRIVSRVGNGGIIVLHDGNRGRGGDRSNTVAAVKLIVPKLRAQGYRFVTIPELIRLGVQPRNLPASQNEED
jgi:peptidoglycan/xylan/chitin deacetylase (PgdA/CDA1 family)